MDGTASAMASAGSIARPSSALVSIARRCSAASKSAAVDHDLDRSAFARDQQRVRSHASLDARVEVARHRRVERADHRIDRDADLLGERAIGRNHGHRTRHRTGDELRDAARPRATGEPRGGTKRARHLVVLGKTAETLETRDRDGMRRTRLGHDFGDEHSRTQSGALATQRRDQREHAFESRLARGELTERLQLLVAIGDELVVDRREAAERARLAGHLYTRGLASHAPQIAPQRGLHARVDRAWHPRKRDGGAKRGERGRAQPMRLFDERPRIGPERPHPMALALAALGEPFDLGEEHALDETHHDPVERSEARDRSLQIENVLTCLHRRDRDTGRLAGILS